MNELQIKILDIYKIIKEICDRNKITYFGIGGTCIGAVRHKGFIPWDDDLDIAVPIEEYDKLIDCLKKELPDYLEIFDCNNTRHNVNIFMKVIDTRTTFIEKTEMPFKDSYKGVYVDIMPMSGYPFGKFSQELTTLYIRLLCYLNYVRRFPYDNSLPIYGKLLWVFITIFRWAIPYNLFTNLWIKKMKHYPIERNEYCATTYDANILSRMVFKSNDLIEKINIEFEDTVMTIPRNYDVFLRRQFGEYMQLPSEEKRVGGHDGGIIDLNKSYKEYINK